MKRFHLTNVALALALLLTLTLSKSALAAPVSGAILTTLNNGTVVNGNQYDSKCAVYLDGGPGSHAPANAAGLPNGDYYFQVTDSSGKSLLNTDPVSNRRFTVIGGVIVAYSGFGGPPHPTGFDQDHPELGAITIRLANMSCPTDFLDSPNNGGAYKVWATPVGDFLGDPSQVDNPCGNGCFHGFLPSRSKTDNFRKSGVATFCLTVEKQFQNDDRSFRPGVNWRFDVTDPLSVTNGYFTDSTGIVRVCGLAEGAYTVSETLPQVGFNIVVGLVVNGVALPAQPIYSFIWTADKPAPYILFQNQSVGEPE